MLGVIFLDPPDKPKDFEVWDENWDIVMMFLRLQTQWNVVMGGYVGLKYESLPWMCSLYSIKDRRSMLEGLQIMERTALKKLNERSK